MAVLTSTEPIRPNRGGRPRDPSRDGVIRKAILRLLAAIELIESEGRRRGLSLFFSTSRAFQTSNALWGGAVGGKRVLAKTQKV